MLGINLKTRKLKHLFVLIILVNLYKSINSAEERSALENFLLPFRKLRLSTFDVFRGNLGRSEHQRSLYNSKRLQEPIPESTKFPCDVSKFRSKTVPKSVHQLRPGDIDVIGAMGDSLTAGFGLKANNLVEVIFEDRGKSFSIGGQSTWRSYMTLPNILKEFNPKLIGYSLRASLSIERESQFNVAEGGAISRNMPYMAKVLVNRIKNDRRVDLKNSWKMVTLMIGANDFCSEMCFNKGTKESFFKQHRKDLVEAIRILRDNLPRTIVNLIPPPHLKILTQLENKPKHCHISHSFLCPCLVGLAHSHKQKQYFESMKIWQKMDIKISNYPEFDLDDFTVVAQPFFLNYTFPKNLQGALELTYLSHDCFHLSQKGNAKLANDLWNSIMEPVEKKSTDGTNFLSKFHCPTEKNPYIYTKRNSR